VIGGDFLGGCNCGISNLRRRPGDKAHHCGAEVDREHGNGRKLPVRGATNEAANDPAAPFRDLGLNLLLVLL
jgi:hypothetical protein